MGNLFVYCADCRDARSGRSDLGVPSPCGRGVRDLRCKFFAAGGRRWLNCQTMEQPHVPAAAAVAIASLGRALSDEARASLEAVRVAQEAARLRARRQTTHARIWLIALLGAGVFAAVSFAPRVARWRHARSHAATSARPALATATAVAPVAPIASATTLPAVETRKPALPVANPSTTAVAPAVAQARDVAGAHADEGCDMSLIRTAPWRLSPQACARAFESDSSNAALALAIAHAEHGNGRLAEAAQWAKRALALDASAAEAYVMIARADVKDGRPDDARTSYRRYLELAPRGWHATEARAAVRRAHTPAPLDSARDR